MILLIKIKRRIDIFFSFIIVLNCFYCPSVRNTAYAAWNCNAICLNKCTCCGNITEPVIQTATCTYVSCQHLDVVERTTIGEHELIAIASKCCGWQRWSGSQSCTFLEHLIVAFFCERCSGQFGSRGQRCATLEHLITATLSECCSGHYWSCCQRGTTIEHLIVAIICECCGW